MADLDPVWEVSVEEVKAMLDSKQAFLLLDVREPDEHATARIPGAELVPLGDLPAVLPRLQEHADKPVIAHCHMGGRSLKAAVFLRQQGFQNVKSMGGGIEAWALRIDPTVPRY